MTNFPERDAGGVWCNETPIADIHEALHLLAGDPSSTETPHLLRRYGVDRFVWEIVIPSHHNCGDGRESEGDEYYQIAPEVGGRLVTERLVQLDPCATEWFVITHEAKRAIPGFERTLVVKAAELLKSAADTDLFGHAEVSGSGREHRIYGRFYVDFRMSSDTTCRVYPEQGDVIDPYPPAEETIAETSA